MVWQDTVIFVCTLFFVYSLIPQIIRGYKEKKGLIAIQTSLFTGLGMSVLAVVYFTLQLYWAFSIDIVLAIGWFVLFGQRLKYGPTKQ